MKVSQWFVGSLALRTTGVQALYGNGWLAGERLFPVFTSAVVMMCVLFFGVTWRKWNVFGRMPNTGVSVSVTNAVAVAPSVESMTFRLNGRSSELSSTWTRMHALPRL